MREVDGGEEERDRASTAAAARADRGEEADGWGWSGHALVDRAAGRRELRLEREGAEGLLVLGEVVAEDVQQRLGLLGTEVDALEVVDLDLVGRLLVHGAEDEEEVPDAHADLDAVGVAVAVVSEWSWLTVGGSEDCLGWLIWVSECDIGLPEVRGWCERGDLNPHGLLRQILSLVRLPISPLSRGDAAVLFSHSEWDLGLD